ncbi:MAG TPA: phosphoribosyltransferase family protein [Blastocatellia bacterium]|nr:phosphoribosyltransferase family protein [Blastocatellia bacterium]
MTGLDKAVAPLLSILPLSTFVSEVGNTLLGTLRSIRDGVLGLAYPQACRVCGDAVQSWDDGVACARCWDDPIVTRFLTGALCEKCGTQVSRGTGEYAEPVAGSAPRSCGTCSSLPFITARACGSYSGALEASILFLKVSPHICPRLNAIIDQTFSKHRATLDSEVLMPIPLHRVRERRRGFNQAATIATSLSRRFNLRFDDRSLRRTRPTDPHRAGMDAADRARSVDRAFEVTRHRLVKDTSVLLVDDVYTTGSTICSAARSLIEAGARQVKVFTIARVINI